MIHDAATQTHVGDSFDIAVYLDQKYPQSGLRLFPPGSIGVHRAFNAYVDALFTRHIILNSNGIPFDPETEEASKAEFVRRAQVSGAPVSGWDDFVVGGEVRMGMIEAFKAELEEFAKLYRFDDGPFLEGKSMSYADIVVGAWLAMLKTTFAEWGQVCEWQGGRWERLHEALEGWAEVR